MILYHGGLVIVESPALAFSKGKHDFGSGFYLTSSLEQAIKWAKRNMRINNINQGFVSVFEFEDNSTLRRKEFIKPDLDWLQFVVDNRLRECFNDEWDLVVGPVADDQAYNTIILYEDGLIDADFAIKKLLTEKLQDQYLFKTEVALNNLKFLKYIEVTNDK